MLKTLLSKLHRDEQGADMIEYILIFAAVALPLLGVLIFFWKDISRWAGELWTGAQEGEETNPDSL